MTSRRFNACCSAASCDPYRAVLGVEIGHLVFVAAVLTAGGLLRRAIALCLEPPLVQQTVDRLDVSAAYAIGIVAAYWLMERTSAFFV
jgi:hypothetical protein